MDLAAHTKSLEAIAADLRKLQENEQATAQSNTALTHVEQAAICLKKHAESAAAKARAGAQKTAA